VSIDALRGTTCRSAPLVELLPQRHIFSHHHHNQPPGLTLPTPIDALCAYAFIGALCSLMHCVEQLAGAHPSLNFCYRGKHSAITITTSPLVFTLPTPIDALCAYAFIGALCSMMHCVEQLAGAHPSLNFCYRGKHSAITITTSPLVFTLPTPIDALCAYAFIGALCSLMHCVH